MAKVRLAEVTADTVSAVASLQVLPDQEKFVAPNALSIAQAYFTKEHWFRAVAVGEELVVRNTATRYGLQPKFRDAAARQADGPRTGSANSLDF